jgi:hypothetical protein
MCSCARSQRAVGSTGGTQCINVTCSSCDMALRAQLNARAPCSYYSSFMDSRLRIRLCQSVISSGVDHSKLNVEKETEIPSPTQHTHRYFRPAIGKKLYSRW